MAGRAHGVRHEDPLTYWGGSGCSVAQLPSSDNCPVLVAPTSAADPLESSRNMTTSQILRSSSCVAGTEISLHEYFLVPVPT